MFRYTRNLRQDQKQKPEDRVRLAILIARSKLEQHAVRDVEHIVLLIFG